MGTKITREVKQNWILSKIVMSWESGEPIFVEDLAARFATELKSTNRTAMEIIRNFERIGRFDVISDGDKNLIVKKELVI